MTNNAIQLMLGDAEQEASCLHAIVTQAIETRSSLFLGRFLTDFSASDAQRLSQNNSHIMLRQYGHSQYVNAQPIVANVRRIEIGLEEAEEALKSGKYDTVLLSQVLTAVGNDMLRISHLFALLGQRPDQVTLVLTGSSAPVEILAECRRFGVVLPGCSHGGTD